MSDLRWFHWIAIWYAVGVTYALLHQFLQWRRYKFFEVTFGDLARAALLEAWAGPVWPALDALYWLERQRIMEWRVLRRRDGKDSHP